MFCIRGGIYVFLFYFQAYYQAKKEAAKVANHSKAKQVRFKNNKLAVQLVFPLQFWFELH